MRRKIKRKPTSEEARKRYLIYRLRGAYQLFDELKCIEGKEVIDKELKKRGAEEETARKIRMKKEHMDIMATKVEFKI